MRTDAITSGDGKLLDAGPSIEQLHLDGPTGSSGTGESGDRYNSVEPTNTFLWVRVYIKKCKGPEKDPNLSNPTGRRSFLAAT